MVTIATTVVEVIAIIAMMTLLAMTLMKVMIIILVMIVALTMIKIHIAVQQDHTRCVKRVSSATLTLPYCAEQERGMRHFCYSVKRCLLLTTQQENKHNT